MRVLGAVSITSLFFAIGCFAPIIDLGSLGQVSPLSEVTIVDGGEARLVLLELTGVISFEESGWNLGGQKPSMVSRMHEALDLAARDGRVRGLVLRVRSPGGGAAASETLHHLVKTWREQTRKPVVAYLQEVAASGGYYVAMAADHVIAHPASIAGSIGVLMPGVNLSGLMGRFGVEDQSLTSGAFKDTGSAMRPMREDERAQLQSVIDDLYRRFVDVVDAGRPKLDRGSVEQLADGRVFTANQALEAGLVDEVGYLEEAIGSAERLAGISNASVVSYREGGESANSIYSNLSTQTAAPKTEINVLSIGPSQLPAGFYYLWPQALSR
ncbi:MAG: signal peptide peptidase SppA [bacterium]|nr:signal peptide peptidase SppA [bacterium]